MRTLKLHFPNDALPTLDAFLQQTKEARVFHRAQAVCEVVKGQRLQTVSDTLHFTYDGSGVGRHGLTLRLLTCAALHRRCKLERGTSGRWRQSGAGRG